MADERQSQRDLARMRVARAGRLVETGDPFEPYRLLDAAGEVLVPVAIYLRELQAAGRSPATLRSYSLELLRWMRFLWAVGVSWDRATQVEAREFARWLQVGGEPSQQHSPSGEELAGRSYSVSVRAHSESVLRKFYDFHREAGTGLPPPADAVMRAERLGRSVARWQAIRADVLAVETEIETLLAVTPGQVLTTLPGVAAIRAAGFAAFSLPIDRFPTAEHLYSATGLAPARYQSATINRTGRIARTGLAEHRDALMGIAWGLSLYCGPFIERNEQLRARGMNPIQARVALARHACRLTHRMLRTQQPFDEQRYRQGRHRSER